MSVNLFDAGAVSYILKNIKKSRASINTLVASIKKKMQVTLLRPITNSSVRVLLKQRHYYPVSARAFLFSSFSLFRDDPQRKCEELFQVKFAASCKQAAIVSN